MGLPFHLVAHDGNANTQLLKVVNNVQGVTGVAECPIKPREYDHVTLHQQGKQQTTIWAFLKLYAPANSRLHKHIRFGKFRPLGSVTAHDLAELRLQGFAHTSLGDRRDPNVTVNRHHHIFPGMTTGLDHCPWTATFIESTIRLGVNVKFSDQQLTRSDGHVCLAAANIIRRTVRCNLDDEKDLEMATIVTNFSSKSSLISALKKMDTDEIANSFSNFSKIDANWSPNSLSSTQLILENLDGDLLSVSGAFSSYPYSVTSMNLETSSGQNVKLKGNFAISPTGVISGYSNLLSVDTSSSSISLSGKIYLFSEGLTSSIKSLNITSPEWSLEMGGDFESIDFGSESLSKASLTSASMTYNGSKFSISNISLNVLTEFNSSSDVTFDEAEAEVFLQKMLSGADSISGGSGNDWLVGYMGKDTLDGGAGVDTADYSDKTTAIKVTLNKSINATVYVNSTTEDTIKNIENINGGSGADTITGDSLVNTLKGNSGSDVLDGGADTVADIIDGGSGTDTISFASITSTSGVKLTLGTYNITSKVSAQTTASGGSSDKVSNVENITGSKNTDTLTGNAADNVIDGGADTAADVINGGAGTDTISFALIAGTIGVTFALGAYNATAKTTAQTIAKIGATSTDKVSNVENITGSKYADVLTGNDDNNVINGGAGADTLTGGKGLDKLYGGSGDGVKDTFFFSAASESTTTSMDLIYDFVSSKDKIDLSGMTPSTNKSGAFLNDTTKVLGTTYKANSVWITKYDASGTVNDYVILSADLDGKSGADFAVKLVGINNIVTADLVL